MMTTETMIDADTEALHAIAEHFPNIEVVHLPVTHSHRYRWEVQLIDPRQYLGEIELAEPDILQSDTERRIILRREFLRILKETGRDR